MLNKSEPQTLEEQNTELEFSMKESDYQTALRKEMEKIRIYNITELDIQLIHSE